MEAFADLVTISQMTPGPIAINSASFVGMQIAGVGGALVATVATLLPGTSIILIVANSTKSIRVAFDAANFNGSSTRCYSLDCVGSP